MTWSLPTLPVSAFPFCPFPAVFSQLLEQSLILLLVPTARTALPWTPPVAGFFVSLEDEPNVKVCLNVIFFRIVFLIVPPKMVPSFILYHSISFCNP